MSETSTGARQNQRKWEGKSPRTQSLAARPWELCPCFCSPRRASPGMLAAQTPRGGGRDGYRPSQRSLEMCVAYEKSLGQILVPGFCHHFLAG